MNAIILAGGKATRLGPLAPQLNKCLITVGQQPMLVHQINAFRKVGVKNVVVVTSAASHDAVADVVRLAYDRGPTTVHVIDQTGGTSPINALADALHYLLLSGLYGATYIISADTLLDAIPPTNARDDFTWAHVQVSSGEEDRTWCVVESNGRWSDRPAYTGERVYTGLMWTPNVAHAYAKLAPMHATLEPIATATALNALDTIPVGSTTRWQDVGDLEALAQARRERYHSRASNHLRLDNRGVVWKSGADIRSQKWYMLNLPESAQTLFPRVFDRGRDREYGVEHIDQPTLAELWAYWPGDTGMWVRIIERLLERVSADLWSRRPRVRAPREVRVGALNRQYELTLRTRLLDWGNPLFNLDKIYINDVPLLAGDALVEAFMPLVQDVATRAIDGAIHGDLSFMNILWSVTTGQPKLLDPRGSFGGVVGNWGDVRYDLAKLRYSYHGGCVSILHGLYEAQARVGGNANLVLTSTRSYDDSKLLDEVLGRYAPLRDVRILEALTCVTAAPLHQGDESDESIALYLRGVQLVNEVMEDT